MDRFDMLLACYLSGQMSEKQWQGHLRESGFPTLAYRTTDIPAVERADSAKTHKPLIPKKQYWKDRGLPAPERPER
jgi:hypothetical protein